MATTETDYWIDPTNGSIVGLNYRDDAVTGPGVHVSREVIQQLLDRAGFIHVQPTVRVLLGLDAETSLRADR